MQLKLNVKAFKRMQICVPIEIIKACSEEESQIS
jgi:hypothetical protein